MRPMIPLLSILFTVAVQPGLAGAQAVRASTPPAHDPAAAALPQTTTASFADWTLRCNRPAPGAQSCEVVQAVGSQDRTVAQIALGRLAKGQPMHLTIAVPASVSFAAKPTLLTMNDADAPVVDLTWRACLPTRCLADAAPPDETLRRIRGWTEPARIVFQDAAGRPVTLPVSPRGLPQALDALAKEEAG